MAACRWGLVDPSPDDVLVSIFGEDYMVECPGLASLVTSIAIGAEDTQSQGVQHAKAER